MYNQKTREWAKHILWISRVKLIYARITLTRYTTVYFFLALLSSILLVVLQANTYISNTEGAQAVDALLAQANVSTTAVGMSFLHDGDVILCYNIPEQDGANCTTLVHRVHSHIHVRDTRLSLDERAAASVATPIAQDLQECAISLMWLGDTLTDARREDFVIGLYQVWLFTLSMVTLLNESLPHLIAGLAARVLATAWGGFRVRGNSNLLTTYTHVITAGQCNGYDALGSWWYKNGANEIAGMVANAVNLVLMAALSFKLYRVYASQTFNRVGASTEINNVYRLVLVLSVILQLAGFFTLAQTGLWISKISFGAIRQTAEHFPIYLAALIVTTVFEIPWLVLGWISVRKESKILFLLFAIISLLLFGISTLLFSSPLYRFVLGQWSFYATMSITAYVLLVATSALGIACRLQFGKGLAHFLHATDTLEEGDFTPVTFTQDGNSPGYYEDEKDDKKSVFESELPTLGYSSKPALQFPPPSQTRKLSTLSLLIEDNQASSTIKLSSTPPLFQNIVAANQKAASAAERTSPIISPISNQLEPIARSLGNSASPARNKAPGRRPPNINVGPTSPNDSYPLPVAGSFVKQHSRAETVDVRSSRKLAKPPQAAVRSLSLSRRGSPPAGYF